VDWIHLAQKKEQFQDLVNKVINLGFREYEIDEDSGFHFRGYDDV
jgi:hypothetical protein